MGWITDIPAHRIRLVVEEYGSRYQCFFWKLDPPRERIGETTYSSTADQGRIELEQRAREYTGDQNLVFNWEVVPRMEIPVPKPPDPERD